MTTLLDCPIPTLTPRQAEILAPREELSLLAWAERHLKVTEGPLAAGGGIALPWSPETFPLQRTVIEAIDDPHWARLVLMTGPQTFGKTLAVACTVLLHGIGHREVTVIYVAGNANLANSQWLTKFKAVMLADPELEVLIPDNVDHAGDRLRRDFTTGKSMHVVGSESAANLAGKTAPIVFCDDVQDYGTLPKHGHPADYAATRAEAYGGREATLAFAGTATTVEDWLWRALKASAFFCPFVPCLGCGTYQLLEFDRLQFDPEDPVAALDETWMKCANPECDHQILFEELSEMLADHQWVSMPPEVDWVRQPAEGGTVLPEGAHVYPRTGRNTNIAGFWCNALYWPFGKTWGERAAEFSKRRGNPDQMKDFQQNVQVVPWEEPEIDEQRLTIAEVEGHQVEGHKAGTVPAEADVLTATVDVQSGYVYYSVRAWRRSDGTSWLIALGTKGRPIRGKSEETIRSRRTLGITRGLDEVDALLAEGFPQVGEGGEEIGRLHPVLVLVDRGFEGDIVASWCSVKGRGIWRMIMGARGGGKRGSLWPLKPTLDRRQRPYRAVDTNQAKHLVRRQMRIRVGQPGYWHMPAEGLHPNTVRAYARHLCSERFNRELKNPRWEPVTPGVANHFWDCDTYHICAAVACRVRLGELQAAAPAAPVAEKRPRLTTPDGRPFLLTER